MTVFTIGYEGRNIEEYSAILESNHIRLVVDVRRNPISRKPGFSKTRMREYLASCGIEYRHFPELGIDSDRRYSLRTNGDVENLLDWYRSELLPEKAKALEALVALAKCYGTIALTCLEADPSHCHRSAVAEKLTLLLANRTETTHL